MRNNPRSTRVPFASINITPFVDITLVLLVIFMIVVPVVQHDGVQLPTTHRPSSAAEAALTIGVHVGGIVTLEGVVMRADELSGAVQRLHAEHPERHVVVKGDRRLSYGDVLSVLRLARKAGFSDVTLAAERG